MRKKITRRLSFCEVNGMTIHEILDVFKITFATDISEKTMDADCRNLKSSDEFRNKFAVPLTRQWTSLERNLNLITLIHAAQAYGLSYPNWGSFARMLEAYIYDKTNVINLPYQTIGTTYNMDAMTHKDYSTKLLNYTNTSLQNAPEHLSLITGVDKAEMKDFCDKYLADAIIYFKDAIKSSSNKIMRNWHIRLINKINDCIYPVHGYSMQEFITPVGCRIKRIAVADYVIFLTVIKHANEKDHNLVVRLLTWQEHELIDYAVWYHIYEKFVCTYPFSNNKEYISVCPQEQIFAISNYFKPEYVYDDVDTEDNPCDNLDDKDLNINQECFNDCNNITKDEKTEIIEPSKTLDSLLGLKHESVYLNIINEKISRIEKDVASLKKLYDKMTKEKN